MTNPPPKILIISSYLLSAGPSIIAEQFYDALLQNGVDVDLLLKIPYSRRPEILSVWEKDFSKLFWNRQKRKIKNWLYGFKQPQGPYCFFYRKENEPPVPTKDVLNRIKKKYDLVCILFWQELLSFETIEGIYDKLHCQFQFLCVDYSPMSGGCHFTNDCQHYITGCGCCPAFDSTNKNDFTAWNVKYRKRVYDKVNPIVYGNTYMREFFKKSFLLKNARVESSRGAIINTEIFKPLDKEIIRNKYKKPLHKKILIFFACQELDNERKGISYLIESLKRLYNTIGEQRESILVITAGKNHDVISKCIPFDSKGFGYVPIEQLPELFSLSTFFVCSSVDDAGPMMVGQSLSCGTPVVGFDMGAVRLLVKDKGTGICVPLRDSKALTFGMETMIKMPKEEYNIMVSRCRNLVQNYCSYSAQAKMILDNYYKYRD